MTYFHSLSLSEVCDRYEPLVVILLVYTRSFWIIVLFPLIDIDRWTISKGYTTRTATLSSNDHDFFNGTWFLPDDISYTIPAREPERFFFFFFFSSNDPFARHIHMYASNKLPRVRFQLVPFFPRYLEVVKFFFSFFAITQRDLICTCNLFREIVFNKIGSIY